MPLCFFLGESKSKKKRQRFEPLKVFLSFNYFSKNSNLNKILTKQSREQKVAGIECRTDTVADLAILFFAE